MVIGLKQLYENPGEIADFTAEITSERLNEIHGYSFIGPVVLKGSVKNRAGIVTLNMTAYLTISAECDRCLGSFERDFVFDFEHVLVRSISGYDNDEYVVTENDELDPEELALSGVLLQMPTKLLCREDCKGLCPLCGADLNVSDCGCKPN
ncbi:MAG: DUF177 domain-containing protein [Ruminococcus sp.]|nr:DUF177 domain-containing protein [Ruminococcus sp.]